MRTWYILTSVILCLVLAPMVQANAVFWDLLIQPTITNDPVPVAGNPALSGIITDHGGDAVIGANVSVRTLGHTAWLETDEHGRFAYSFNETTTTPGLHSVLIHATADGLGGEKTGFADITYRVEGGSGLSAEEKILATEDARKYLNANENDFTNDLVGSLLYEYYNDLYQVHLEKIAREQQLQEQNDQLLKNRVKGIMEIEESVVVFCHHKAIHKLLHEQLTEFSPVSIIGGQSDKDRQNSIDDFQDGKSNLMIAGLRAGNVGINLSRARYVVFAELDWSPAIHRQAEDRLHRLGQKNTVFAYYLVGDGTLDNHCILAQWLFLFHSNNKNIRKIRDNFRACLALVYL